MRRLLIDTNHYFRKNIRITLLVKASHVPRELASREHVKDPIITVDSTRLSVKNITVTKGLRKLGRESLKNQLVDSEARADLVDIALAPNEAQETSARRLVLVYYGNCRSNETAHVGARYIWRHIPIRQLQES